MKRYLNFPLMLTVVVVLCVAVVSHAADKPKFTKHFNDSLFDITEKGLFSIEILMDDKEYDKLGKGVIGLVIHNQYDEDVEGAEIKITAATPEGKTVGNDAPVVKDKGEGLYTVTNIDPKKKGKWQLRIIVKKKKAEDGASFSFPDALDKPLRKGLYSAD